MTRALLLAVLLAAAPLSAQRPEPPSTGGLSAFTIESGMLGQRLRVLVIGAHPDDEDTELIALLVRGYGAEVAYLSLNRGEGGQNLIGPELGEGLGIIRTEELLAARSIDGARQYFTRAYDFGYSKNLADTWAHWPRDSVLKDVIRVLRQFRPQVIVSIFSGLPRDGHGQHQAAGWAAQQAFAAAGDPGRFPELQRDEQLAPWSPTKLYRSARFDTAATTLTLDGGRLDVVSGRTFHQIAMQSRSLHRSQDMGQLQALGPSPVRLALMAAPPGGEASFLAGVDTALSAVLGSQAATYGRLTRSIRSSDGAAPDSVYARAASLLSGATGVEAADQATHLARAWAAARGIAVDAVLSDHDLAPGDSALLTASISGAAERYEVRVSVEAGRGIDVNPASQAGSLAPPALLALPFSIRVAATAPLTTPYYLRLPRVGDLYQWSPADRPEWGSAFERDPVRVRFTFPVTGLSLVRAATARARDQILGEVRSPVTLVPQLGVRVDRDTVLLSTTQPPAELELHVSLANGVARAQAGTLTIETPAGWPAVAAREFTLERENERQTLVFHVPVPSRLSPDTYDLQAVATVGGRRFDAGLQAISYPHLRTRVLEHSASVTVVAARLAIPPLVRIGYIRGASDRIPESLIPAGFPIEVIDSTQLDRGDLSRYDAIVVGPRAYEIDSALVEHNGRLLEYVQHGGLLLVQYQQYQFVRGRFAPFPLEIREPHDRVTDEHATVTAIDPSSPALAGPNHIASDDWEGWVQERGLYFAGTWDAAYAPVIEMADPGEDPLRGSVLIAPSGRGHYVYTGLAFFRELPAGVPGAFRLFANLLALPRAPQP